MYALGQTGWSVALFGTANLLNYFYLPPEQASEAVFPDFFFQGNLFAGLTIIGLIAFGGRFFDAITDPLIAGWTDRSTAKFGRRRTYLAISFLPAALFSFLIFFPIVAANSPLNILWLCFCALVFYFFMTMYFTPYTALISELAHNTSQRLTLSTILSVTFALGFGIGSTAFALQPFYESSFGWDSTFAFQMVIATFAALAAILMALPVIFVDEKKYCIASNSKLDTWTAIREVFQNRNFTWFMISDLMYWFSLTFIQMGIVYYITVLLNMEKSWASIFLPAMLGGSFLVYIPINVLARKHGKRPLMLAAFLSFSALFGLTYFLGKLPFTGSVQLGMVAFLGIFPLAVFSILPNAIIADIVDLEGQRTGDYKSGMYFAVRGFMTKLGISGANLIFPSLLLLGRSTENPLGVRATAIAAMILCLIGFFCFYQYKDVIIEKKAATGGK